MKVLFKLFLTKKGLDLFIDGFVKALVFFILIKLLEYAIQFVGFGFLQKPELNEKIFNLLNFVFENISDIYLFGSITALHIFLLSLLFLIENSREVLVLALVSTGFLAIFITNPNLELIAFFLVGILGLLILLQFEAYYEKALFKEEFPASREEIEREIVSYNPEEFTKCSKILQRYIELKKFFKTKKFSIIFFLLAVFLIAISIYYADIFTLPASALLLTKSIHYPQLNAIALNTIKWLFHFPLLWKKYGLWIKESIFIVLSLYSVFIALRENKKFLNLSGELLTERAKELDSIEKAIEEVIPTYTDIFVGFEFFIKAFFFTILFIVYLFAISIGLSFSISSF